MFHLVCVHPFGKYTKGQKITDADEVARLMRDRGRHFVRVPAPTEHHDEVEIDGAEYRRV